MHDGARLYLQHIVFRQQTSFKQIVIVNFCLKSVTVFDITYETPCMCSSPVAFRKRYGVLSRNWVAYT